MVTTPPETVNSERPFEMGQIFYSRTDGRGVIEGANWVFQRIAGFDWDELLGAPHKIVRHPDMPRGVFRLMWDSLGEGRSFAGYVKNRAKDGTYYWVLANVSAIEGGYLSVRIKPGTPHFDRVREIYADLLAQEAAEQLSPEQSAERLVAAVAALGFPDYERFGAVACRDEALNRVRALGHIDTTGLGSLRQTGEILGKLETSVGDLMRAVQSIRQVPANMRIVAKRLEPVGGPITSIAISYANMAGEMDDWVQAFLTSSGNGFAAMHAAMTRANYLAAAATIQREVERSLRHERRGEAHIDMAAEMALLDGLASDFEFRAREALVKLNHQTRRLSQDLLEMKRFVMSLATTRTLCRIENARLDAGAGSLDAVIARLDEFQSTIDSQLDDIARANRAIQRMARALVERGIHSRGARRRTSPSAA